MIADTLKERCKTTTNFGTDTFVGIKATHGEVLVNFPLGYCLADDEKDLRRDILLLINTLSRNTPRKDSEISNEIDEFETSLPIASYLYVIADYYSRGYYREREARHTISKRGKINWNRTVKTQRPYIQGNELYYLDYVIKKQSLNENEIITLIHKFCVYESFMKIGWLFSSFIPEKPTINAYKRKKHCIAAINEKLSHTFNDRNKQLFKHLLLILEGLGDNENADIYTFGTTRFEYVWESMIDKVYGERNKVDYFPKTHWMLKNKKEYDNSYLEPDTIMLANNRVYVLDAKYYKYGNTADPKHLPESTSINKQITYGEYIAEADMFKDELGNGPKVYNAFLMPYNAQGEVFQTNSNIHYVGTAYSDWKSTDGTKPYEQVVGILIDVKSLMQHTSKDLNLIYELADLIEKST